MSSEDIAETYREQIKELEAQLQDKNETIDSLKRAMINGSELYAHLKFDDDEFTPYQLALQKIQDLEAQLQGKEIRYDRLLHKHNDLHEKWAGIEKEYRLQIADLTAQLQAAKSEAWVSVEERKPPELVGVLVYIPEQDHINTAIFEEKEGWYETYEDIRIPNPVTHWMPLPSPPDKAAYIGNEPKK